MIPTQWARETLPAKGCLSRRAAIAAEGGIVSNGGIKTNWQRRRLCVHRRAAALFLYGAETADGQSEADRPAPPESWTWEDAVRLQREEKEGRWRAKRPWKWVCAENDDKDNVGNEETS